MTEDTVTKEQAAQLVFNAEIKKDIASIKESLTGITADLKMYAAQFVPNSLFLEHKKEADKVFDEFKEKNDKVLESYDDRIRFLEHYAWAAIGVIGFLEIAFEAWRTFHGQ